MGVRMGSSEIYSAVEDLEEVEESLIIGYEQSDDKYFMPLFVVLKEGIKVDDALKEKINKKIRETLSPRHVPDDIFAVTAIPKTLNNKKLEVPVKKILMGIPIEKAVNLDSMINPECLIQFVELSKTFSNK
jgi:acetoacetyl-CoA synthetase